ncbi:MAG TPA: DUF3617 domain-containing protein [Bryocella sp.]|nr:DUF3617 domain-containing protein [Bryocella sp.]
MFLNSILAAAFVTCIFVPAASQKHEAAPVPIPGISLPTIKPGLWEETLTIPNSSTMKTRSCVTEQSYQSTFGKMPPGCTVSNVKQSGNTIAADLSCSMQGVSGSGHIQAQLLDPGTAHTSITYTSSVQGQTMQGSMSTDAHWISSDCGHIPPGETRDVD